MNWLSDLVCWIGCQTHTCVVLDIFQPALQNRIGAWLIMFVLGIVWGIMLSVPLYLLLIAKHGDDEDKG